MADWNDDELIDYEFKIEGRPDLDDKLSSARPPDGAKLHFLKSYNITPPSDVKERRALQPYVWCALCQEPTHWIGWRAEVVDAPEPTEILVGRVCARRKGSAAVKVAANDFDARVARSEALRARRAVLSVVPEVIEALRAWKSDPDVEAIGVWRTALRQTSGHLWDQLQQQAKVSPAVLMTSRLVRDLEAERIRRERGADPLSIGDRYRTEHVPAGRLMGAAVYAADPGIKIILLRERLEAAAKALAKPTAETKTRQIQSALRQVRDVCHSVDVFVRDYAQAPDAFKPEALDILFSWLTREGVGRFTRNGAQLVYFNEERKPVVLAIPRVGTITKPAAMGLLEEALLGRAPSEAA